MVKKEIIDASIAHLQSKNVIKVRSIPSFSLSSSVEEAKELLKEAILAVDKSISKLEWMSEYDKVAKWMVNSEGKGLNLTGDPGRLKTVITSLALPLLFHAKFKMTVRPVDSFNIEESYGYFNQSPIVIVDDIGAEPPVNDYGIRREPFNTLVDFCEKKSKVLIITNNLSSSVIQERYGIRTLDRLDLLCKPIKFTGESFR